MITLRGKRNRFQVLNIVEGTGANYPGLFVSPGTEGRKAEDLFLWFPTARPQDLVNKAALLLKLSIDRGFLPGQDSDEPALFSMETTPVHLFLREALIVAANWSNSHDRSKRLHQSRSGLCRRRLVPLPSESIVPVKMSTGVLFLKNVASFGCIMQVSVKYHHFFVEKASLIDAEGYFARERDRLTRVGVVPFLGTGPSSGSETGSVPGIGYT
ncbi:MAG: hypothetical protein QNK37_28705 [Acidobacteriota bacterium]|nr:hypothetical protein [Acidobacteriota bacterium]